MKTLLILLLLCFCFAFAVERKFTLTEGQAVLLFQSLETAKKALPASEVISAKEASTAIMQIDSIQRVLIRQAQDTVKH